MNILIHCVKDKMLWKVKGKLIFASECFFAHFSLSLSPQALINWVFRKSWKWKRTRKKRWIQNFWLIFLHPQNNEVKPFAKLQIKICRTKWLPFAKWNWSINWAGGNNFYFPFKVSALIYICFTYSKTDKEIQPEMLLLNIFMATLKS